MSRTNRPVRRPPRFWLGCLLAVALLVAQSAGLSHMLRHAGYAPHAVAGQPSHEYLAASPGDDTHSCVLYDAESLGSGPPSAPPLTLPERCHATPLPALAEQTPHIAFPSPFLSRAPPSMDRLS